MLALHEIQQAYLEYYQSGNLPESLKTVTNNDNIAQQTRIDIYKNNTFANLSSALGSTYPRILSLVGKDFFEQITYDFIKNNMPEVSCLDNWGDKFPDYLVDIGEKYELPYLYDVARLEWLLQLAYTALDVEALDAGELAKYSPEQLVNKQFRLCPAVSLFKSEYNIVDIIKIDDGELNGDEVDMIKDCYCVVSRGIKPVTLWLESKIYNSIELLDQGKTLAELSESIAELDFQNLLIFLIENQILSKD